MSKVERSYSDYLGNGPLRLVDCLIERAQTELPSYYLSDTAGVLIAGDAMLRAAGHLQKLSRERISGWRQYKRGIFRHETPGDLIHQVRQCGGFWVVECFVKDDFLRFSSRNVHVLVCAFSGWPICARPYQAAMRLADYCAPIPRPPIAGYWKPVEKAGIALIDAIAERRRVNGQVWNEPEPAEDFTCF